ncbi:MAG: hypothetical protein MJ054_01515 [Clostridia bacterium]|nr:hypothetical protein [Clostridia bacterium]
MLFNYELKKIWQRVSPLLVLIVLLSTTIATIVLTAIFFNHTPKVQPNVTADYATLQNKISNWNTSIDHKNFTDAFDDFYKKYKTMNASTSYNENKLVENYNNAKTSFQNFYLEYYLKYIKGENQNISDYLLVNSKYTDSLDEVFSQLDKFFNQDNPSNDSIVQGLKATNTKWEDTSLQVFLENLFFVQKIDDKDLANLKLLFTKYPANITGYDYTNAYNYALNRYWIAVATSSKYTGKLSNYSGFDGYKGLTTSTQACKLALYRLEHSSEDFATPFAFGNIFNNSHQISLFDFVFTNLEMAIIPVTLLVIIWAICSFFTDNNQGTIITTISAGKKRSTIILTKTSVILLLLTTSLILLTTIYTVAGLLIFKAYISPKILFLFNGTKVISMSPLNYFAVYLLNIIFKMLPLIAICGLFSLLKNKIFVIAGITTTLCIIVIVLNAFLGKFDFYQYIPFMGLDPIRYFGAKLMFAPMPENYNILYTVPIIAAVTVVLYWSLIQLFRHHDF